MARAISSLPVPVSPVISTVAVVGATRATRSITPRRAVERPRMKPSLVARAGAVRGASRRRSGRAAQKGQPSVSRVGHERRICAHVGLPVGRTTQHVPFHAAPTSARSPASGWSGGARRVRRRVAPRPRESQCPPADAAFGHAVTRWTAGGTGQGADPSWLRGRWPWTPGTQRGRPCSSFDDDADVRTGDCRAAAGTVGGLSVRRRSATAQEFLGRGPRRRPELPRARHSAFPGDIRPGRCSASSPRPGSQPRSSSSRATATSPRPGHGDMKSGRGGVPHQALRQISAFSTPSSRRWGAVIGASTSGATSSARCTRGIGRSPRAKAR